MSVMIVCLTILGGLLGGAWEGGGGFVAGALLGGMLGGLLSQRRSIGALREELGRFKRRLHRLEREAAARTEKPAASFAVRPLSIPLADEGPSVVPPREESPAGAAAPPAEERPATREEPPLTETSPLTETAPGPDEYVETPVPRYDFDPIEKLRRFFTTGNVVAKVGLIVLFFGVAFLLKYAAERNMVPLELRYAGVAVGAMVMLGLGWRLRESHRTYALLIEGGAVGILYITVFMAARIHHLMPAGPAFMLMFALVVLGNILAVLQDSKVTAVFSIVGGFLAPFLTSPGAGGHVMLFTYFALLNIGVLGIAWFRTWRELNLLGFFATLLLGGWWGLAAYEASLFASTEPFLVAFFLLYVAVAVLYALRQPVRLKGFVDGTLVFGAPIACSTLQTGMAHVYEYGLALSALGLGLFYVTLAISLWRRAGVRLLSETFLSLGVVFATLAVPLALDGRWTSVAWALEGAGMVWVGLRQRRLLARSFGLLLQLGAGLFFFLDIELPYGDLAVFNGFYLGCLMVTAAGLFSALMLERHADRLRAWESRHCPAMMTWALVWWYVSGLMECERQVAGRYELHAFLLLFAGSALLWQLLHRFLNWRALFHSLWILLPAMLLVAGIDLTNEHPLADLGWLAWPAAFVLQYLLLRLHEGRLPGPVRRFEHWAGLWLLLFLVGWEVYWAVGELVRDADTWAEVSWPLVTMLLCLFLILRGELIRWPVGRHREDYLGLGLLPVMLVLLLWCLTSSVLAPADPWPLPFIPLLNPLELTQAFIVLVLLLWWRRLDNLAPAMFHGVSPWHVAAVMGLSIFIMLNGALARAVHHLGGVRFNADAMFASMTYQASLSIFWSVLALALMGWAARKASRTVWFSGAGLLAVTVVKLFFVDMGGLGTVTRIISFIAVGLIMLVIGYFSPLPPKEAAE